LEDIVRKYLGEGGGDANFKKGRKKRSNSYARRLGLSVLFNRRSIQGKALPKGGDTNSYTPEQRKKRRGGFKVEEFRYRG